MLPHAQSFLFVWNRIWPVAQSSCRGPWSSWDITGNVPQHPGRKIFLNSVAAATVTILLLEIYIYMAKFWNLESSKHTVSTHIFKSFHGHDMTTTRKLVSNEHFRPYPWSIKLESPVLELNKPPLQWWWLPNRKQYAQRPDPLLAQYRLSARGRGER